MSNRNIAVGAWSDIEAVPDVSDRDKQRVATIFTEQSWDYVVWIPTWLLEDGEKDVETVESSDHLAVGDVEDYSEKAWKLLQPHLHDAAPGTFLPKSQVVVFERARGVEEIETPQQGLTAFAGGPDE